MNTLILGASGLAGTAVVRLMTQLGREFLKPTSRELNLLDSSSVKAFFDAQKIETVYFFAARVGGAPVQSIKPLEFLIDNLKMEINVLETALEKKIPRLIFLSSSTIYPEFAPQPLKENYILAGKPSASVQPYALAKLTGMEIVRIAAEVYGLSWVSAISSNLYGTGDNFRIRESHVIASIIRKMWEARTTGVKQLEVLGDPNHGRDFLFSDDLASALYFLEEHYFESTPINIGPGTMTSIGDLVRILSELMDYPGEIQWNTTQVSATAQKVLDNSKIRELGFSNFVELRLGLSQVLGWLEREFQSNFKNIRWNE